MTSEKTKELADMLNNAGVVLFSDASYIAKYNAQRNLKGRTHYVDDDTLKYFGSRINTAYDLYNGAAFLIIESTFLNYDKTQRGFRFAVFDCFGNVIERTDTENAYKTAAAAKKGFYKFIDSFNIFDHYEKVLGERITSLQNEATRLSIVRNTLVKNQGA